MYSVYQHWDPLQTCIVGRSYPPEFYSWIGHSRVRSLFEKIATETEEDYQAIIKKLNEFGVAIVRPELPEKTFINGRYLPPPMCPRDVNIMIGEKFYTAHRETAGFNFTQFYNSVKGSNWPNCASLAELVTLPQWIQDECYQQHNLKNNLDIASESAVQAGCYRKIYQHISDQGNTITRDLHPVVNGAFIARIGQDLFVGTEAYNQDVDQIKSVINQEFTATRNHIVNTGGHSDGTYCPVCPGLIISLQDVPTYADTFPGWEVVYLPNQSWDAVKEFTQLKHKNQGRWWIPGFENDQQVVDVVESWLQHWTGYVEETVFDVNMLIVDPKNVIVFNYNKTVFDAFDRYGITAHIVPFRHRYFWDGGIHCLTSDLDRAGTMQNFFKDC
jgi:hypothetical protein